MIISDHDYFHDRHIKNSEKIGMLLKKIKTALWLTCHYWNKKQAKNNTGDQQNVIMTTIYFYTKYTLFKNTQKPEWATLFFSFIFINIFQIFTHIFPILSRQI